MSIHTSLLQIFSLNAQFIYKCKRRNFFSYFSQSEVITSTGGHVLCWIWAKWRNLFDNRLNSFYFMPTLNFVRITSKIRTTEAAEWLTSKTNTSLYLLARNIIFEWGKSLNLNPSFSWSSSSMSSSCGITDKIVNSSSTLSWKIQISFFVK